MVYNRELRFPSELEEFIFKDLEGTYKREFEKVKNTLEYNEDDLRKYLGTYFPRSFTESYNIFADLINSKSIKNNFENKDELFILDIGSGTGGNLLGCLWFIKNFFKFKKINVVSVDGNRCALEYQKTILKRFFPEIKLRLFKASMSRDNFKMRIAIILYKCKIKKFDVIMSFKFINELYRTDQKYNLNKGMYKIITETVSNFIDKDGLFILADVTDSTDANLFIPNIMNEEILAYLNNSPNLRPIVPLSCAFWHKNCLAKRCFTRRDFFFKFNDNSKIRSGITYKVFANKNAFERILSHIIKKDCYKISKGQTCRRGYYNCKDMNSDEYADSFSFDATE